MGKTSKGRTATLSTIGNLLMGLSMVGALITFYPVISEEISYRTQNVFNENPVSTAFNISIKNLKLNAQVLENVDPWDKNEYSQALQRGVAHAKGSATPDGNGSVYLFAHSSDAPWRMTRTNTAFFRLGRIREGDAIVVTYKGQEYRYRVRAKKTVWPNEVKYLTNQKRDQLILQTCTPIGTAFKRLLVFADPISEKTIQ